MSNHLIAYIIANLKIISNIFRRRRVRAIRRAMDGYRTLQSANHLHKIQKIKSDIIDSDFKSISEASSPFFFGLKKDQADLICKQYLYFRLINIRFNEKLLMSFSEGGPYFIYPLPPMWQDLLVRNGVRVSKWGCSLAWIYFLIIHWCWGIFGILKNIFNSISAIAFPDNKLEGEFAYFFNLNSSSLIQGEKSLNIFKWYTNLKNEKGVKIDFLFHHISNVAPLMVQDTAIVFNKNFVSPVTSIRKILYFAWWSWIAIVMSAMDLIRGRWWHALLLYEAATALIVRLQPKEKLARDYLFNNSFVIYRPLWTYEAELLGSKIIFYFYSIPSLLKITNKLAHEKFEEVWRLMTWPTYFVWNDYQKTFVKNFINYNAEIVITGPLSLSDSGEDVPSFDRLAISVFDVQSIRNYPYQILALPEEYHVPKISNKFLVDIHQVLAEQGILMVFKQKRTIGGKLHPRYSKLITKQSEWTNLVSVSPEISALRVIEPCFAVISMPFTSTAFIAESLGKPSIFYDPSGLVEKQNPSAGNIPIINGVDELRKWLMLIIEEKKKSQINM